MLKKIRLFLRGIEADLPQAPDILFNYTEDDLRNPTIVKNSYTKTITLDDTPSNNKIFSEFWDNQFRVGADFNPTKKMPFLLYQNGDLIEEGYARLDSVSGGVNARKYQITLFGGLGDFFYNLMYSDNEGGKRTMADLHYIPVSSATQELAFTINMDTLGDAWENIARPEGGLYDRRWKVINFMPAYEGLPDDFDSDKVLINFYDADLISGATSGSGENISAYTPFDTYYALAEMKHEHTADEMHEFRSYLQRPVLNVKKAIEAICNSENNGGYTVELDTDFFNSNNPYWTDTWVTLPLLKSFETYNDNPGKISMALSGVTKGGMGKPNKYYWQENSFTISGTGYNNDNMYSLQASFTLQWNNVRQLGTPSYAPKDTGLALSDYQSDNPDWAYKSCMVIQLVAYNANGQAVAGGEAINLTSIYQYDNTYPQPSDFGQPLPWGKDFQNSIGRFMPISSGSKNVKWNQPLNLSINYVPYGSTVKLVIRKYSMLGISSPVRYNSMANCVLWGQRNDTTAYTNNWYYSCAETDLPITVEMTSATAEAMNTDVVRTGSHFTKQKLLSTDYSPADFLLSYCKMFGLYFTKDRYEKKIYIRTRNTYYLHDTAEPIDDKIDRGNINIKPVFVGSKWLDFTTEAEEGEFLKQYKEQFGLDYGIQRVNTGYEFNADINSLFNDNIFKGGIPALEKSEGFSYFGEDIHKPWMLEGFTYNLYLSGNTSDNSAITYNEESTIGVLKGWHGDTLKYYDIFEKLQFHDADNSPVDGSNVLVFFNGLFKPDRTKEKFYITDDTADMLLLNDNKPCWLWTANDYDGNNKHVAISLGYIAHPDIPLFSRYKYALDGTTITKSLDFGTPKQLFNPLSTITSGSSLYAQYWENFIKDLYSADTRVVTTRMPLPDNFSEEDMRKFYYFDGGIWRLNAVSEHNIANYEPTKVEFVKVQDIDNYSPS